MSEKVDDEHASASRRVATRPKTRRHAPSSRDTTTRQSSSTTTDDRNQHSDWIKAVCVVTFDLELGQSIERVYPNHIEFSDVDCSNIAFSAFPDSTSACLKDTSYHFCLASTSSTPNERLVSQLPSAMRPIDDHLFGFVHFRQHKLASSPRGYYQKSIVILTHLPLFGLFRHLVDTIALAYFDNGDASIETASEHIAVWPPPQPGVALELPLLGTIINCSIPSRADLPSHQLESTSTTTTLDTSSSTSTTHITLRHIEETSLHEATRYASAHLQTLWELMLVGEPLIVIAPTPTFSSELVQALVSLIWPLPFALEYRPFFTIHDFATFSTSNPTPHALLGSTNPYMEKALRDWPHLLRIDGDGAGSGALLSADRVYKRSNTRSTDGRPGLYTNYRPCLTAERDLVRRLFTYRAQSGSGGGGNDANERQEAASEHSMQLRRHFYELTQSFMIPLERYLSTLMPLRRHVSPFKAAPAVHGFDIEAFISSLAAASPRLKSFGVSGDLVSLYRRFIGSPNFKAWLASRLSEAHELLNNVQLEVLSSVEFSSDALAGRQHAEIVDLVLRLQDLVHPRSGLSVERRSRLQSQLEALLNVIDDELRLVLMSNAQLRDLVIQ